MKVILKKNLTSKKFNVVFKKGIELNYSSDLKAIEHNEIPNVWLSVTEKQFTIVPSKICKEDVIDIIEVMGRELTDKEIDIVVNEHETIFKNSKEGTWDEIVLEQVDKIIENRTK